MTWPDDDDFCYQLYNTLRRYDLPAFALTESQVKAIGKRQGTPWPLVDTEVKLFGRPLYVTPDQDASP